jgi:hypothetical protein
MDINILFGILLLAIGTLIPPLIDGRLQVMIDSAGGNLLLAGIAVAAVGIAFSAWAFFATEHLICQGYEKNISFSWPTQSFSF